MSRGVEITRHPVDAFGHDVVTAHDECGERATAVADVLGGAADHSVEPVSVGHAHTVDVIVAEPRTASPS